MENFFKFRFGSVDEELAKVVYNFLQLPPDDFAIVLLDLSSLSRQ
ncbi:MAG: hypothetical protein RMY29_033925 [Nostoc sp. CreGUA01]|nr:hypothetical protein [Nostoc sp. CreGUA01]